MPEETSAPIPSNVVSSPQDRSFYLPLSPAHKPALLRQAGIVHVVSGRVSGVQYPFRSGDSPYKDRARTNSWRDCQDQARRLLDRCAAPIGYSWPLAAVLQVGAATAHEWQAMSYDRFPREYHWL